MGNPKKDFQKGRSIGHSHEHSPPPALGRTYDPSLLATADGWNGIMMTWISQVHILIPFLFSLHLLSFFPPSTFPPFLFCSLSTPRFLPPSPTFCLELQNGEKVSESSEGAQHVLSANTHNSPCRNTHGHHAEKVRSADKQP